MGLKPVEAITVIFEPGFASFIGEVRKVKEFKVRPGDTDLINMGNQLVAKLHKCSKVKVGDAYAVVISVTTVSLPNYIIVLSFTLGSNGEVIPGTGLCRVG